MQDRLAVLEILPHAGPPFPQREILDGVLLADRRFGFHRALERCHVGGEFRLQVIGGDGKSACSLCKPSTISSARVCVSFSALGNTGISTPCESFWTTRMKPF